jgi:hypothetical protein
MWYFSCLEWSGPEGGRHYNNVIRRLTSADPRQWPSAGVLCVFPDFPDEYSVGRPWVVRDPDGYRMWYSVRSQSRPYRLGYAESADGFRWERRDEMVGLHASESGWDSEMVCYPALIEAGGRRYLFYNGNRHGSTGFGCAVWEP